MQKYMPRMYLLLEEPPDEYDESNERNEEKEQIERAQLRPFGYSLCHRKQPSSQWPSPTAWRIVSVGLQSAF